MSLLWTTGKQESPSCSSCSSPKCNCVRFWKHQLENKVPDKNNETPTENNSQKSHYFLQDTVYFNQTEILYPLRRCPKLLETINSKLDKSFLMPDEIIPDYDPLRLCKHGFRYDSPNLSLLCQTVTVFSDAGENVYPTKIYCRKTTQCRCQMQPDTHDLALFNVGK